MLMKSSLSSGLKLLRVDTCTEKHSQTAPTIQIYLGDTEGTNLLKVFGALVHSFLKTTGSLVEPLTPRNRIQQSSKLLWATIQKSTDSL